MYTRKTSCISLVFFIFLHCLAIQVLSVDTLKQGDQLNSSSRLVSHNGDFALGFHTVYSTNNTYLAVWHISEYPVWMGNREEPIPKNSTPVLTLGTGGELIITRHGGESLVVYGGGSGQINVTATATLLNTGNFVVNSSSGEFLWQSFDHPTDTLLPGMKLGSNRRTGKNWTLSSWFSDSNPVPGAFSMEWDPSVRRVLIRRRGVVYWTSGGLEDYNDGKWGRGKRFENFDPSDPWNLNYNVSAVSRDEEEYVTYSLRVDGLTPDDRKVISRWTLDYEGQLLDSGRPTIARPDECYGYNTNWSLPNKGCQIRDLPNCRKRSMTFKHWLGDFRGAKNVTTVKDSNSNLSLSDCRDVCWNDCECVGYVKSDGDGCEYWRGQDWEFEQDYQGSNMYIRRYVLDSSPSSSSSGSASSTKGMKKHVEIIVGAVGSVVLITLGITFFILRKIRQGKREKELRELLTLERYTQTLENGGGKSHDLKLFTYASIVSATTNFSSHNKLGEGGFGPVYKGRTPEGKDIAVKLLSQQSGQGLLEFKTELVLISKLQHVNLVKLVGFCIHGDDKMIIYDFMHNKSLDFFLFSESKKEQLDWQKRFNIIEGTAQGLLYLHKYSRLRIIHRDLKPSNILLDENMNPKISDFGLARIFEQNASEANTNWRVGTYGYMAPEYAMQGLFSVKSDVYSFGVLVLEIVSGRKNNSIHDIQGPLSIVEYAWELWRNDCVQELMDPALRDSCVIGQLQRCIHIGLLCVEHRAVDRPTIEDVISMLKNETTPPPMPKNPAFIT